MLFCNMKKEFKLPELPTKEDLWPSGGGDAARGLYTYIKDLIKPAIEKLYNEKDKKD